MIGRMAIATAMRERTDEENLAHDKQLLNERVKQKAAERRHAAQLSLDDRWFPMYAYLYAANFIDYFTSHHHFETYILTCIIVASVLVGIEQYPEMSGIYALYLLESIVMHSFIGTYSQQYTL
jgi:hypothetical protein